MTSRKVSTQLAAAPEASITLDDVGATTDLPDVPLYPERVPEYTRLIATSGATGTPKIVVTPSPGVMAVDEQMSKVMGASAGKLYLTTSNGTNDKVVRITPN